MADARILLFFAALLVWALLAAQLGVKSAAAPLAAVCGTTLWFVVWGCFGLLRPAAWAWYLLALGALAWLCVGWLARGQKPPRLSFGFWFFVAVSLAVTGILWVRQPVFSTWDEFSFWGTGAKLTKLYDVFYSQAPVGWPWPATQTPALIAFGYPAQVFGAAFLPWQTYAACDILQFAALAAVLGLFEEKAWNLALPVGAVALVTPYLFTHYAAPAKVSAVYLDSLGDVPLGLLFGAALALYFAAAEKKSPPALAPLALCLPVLALTKDYVGLALALVVAGVALCDTLLGQGHPAKLPRRGLWGWALFASGAALALAAYFGWRAYWTRAVVSIGGSTAGTEETSLTQLPALFVKDLLGGGNESFNQVMGGMPRLFFTSRITLLGSGAVVVAFILVLLALAFWLAGKTALRRRVAVFGAASALGFLAYSLLVAVAYVYIFREDQLFASYERYMYPYYIGWFLAALALLALAARGAAKQGLARGGVLALCALLCVRVSMVIPASYTVLGFNTAEYANQRALGARVQAAASGLGDGDLVFIVSSGDDGSRWFRLCYEFLPVQVDYSFGGGDFGEEVRAEYGGGPEAPDAWSQYLLETGITAVYVDVTDETFRAEYGHLFEGGGEGLLGGTSLYAVESPDGTALHLVPMEVGQ